MNEIHTTWTQDSLGESCMHVFGIKTWYKTARQVANFKRNWVGEHSLKDWASNLGTKTRLQLRTRQTDSTGNSTLGLKLGGTFGPRLENRARK